MNQRKKLNRSKKQRIGRVQALIKGTAVRPRLVVNRSNRYISAQLIDDAKGSTLFSVTNAGGKKAAGAKAGAVQGTGAKSAVVKVAGKKSEQAFALGEAIAKKAIEKGVAQVVFDRRSYQFHGRVKSFAEGAKKGGLKI
jgi:large subunit ribosomal protein L18